MARVCCVLMGLTVAWGIATFFAAVFQCKHIDVAWDPKSTGSGCFQLRAYLVGTNVPNVLLDFAILVTPLYPIWQLKLPTSKKVFISGVFALGAWYAVVPTFSKMDHSLTLCSETAFSVIRLMELTSLDASDATWNYQPPIIWSTIEICVGIFCACLPVMPPLVAEFLRARSGRKEAYDSSSFGLSSRKRATKGFAAHKFDRFEDDGRSLVLGRGQMTAIWQTIDMDIHEEDGIALHTVALKTGSAL